jgi:hypothetical protein
VAATIADGPLQATLLAVPEFAGGTDTGPATYVSFCTNTPIFATDRAYWGPVVSWGALFITSGIASFDSEAAADAYTSTWPNGCQGRLSDGSTVSIGTETRASKDGEVVSTYQWSQTLPSGGQLTGVDVYIRWGRTIGYYSCGTLVASSAALGDCIQPETRFETRIVQLPR